MNEFEMLLPYAGNPTTQKILALLSEGHSRKETASIVGLSYDAIKKRVQVARKRAALLGFSPEHDMTHTVPENYHVKGVSTLYKNGTPVMQWVKSAVNQEAVSEMVAELIAGMKDEITPIGEITESGVEYESDVIPWINIGDAHVNMLSHSDETGQGFNLKAVEIELCKSINMMLSTMPDYERVVINDLGDFTHMENFEGFTHASKNLLDKDGHFPAMIRTAVRIMRYIVESCLNKFKHVDLIINQGNHSRTNDIWMAELFRQVYSNNPRLHILDNTNVFIPYRMGNTFVMTHHGDKCKTTQLANVMAYDYPHDFGETRYRYIYTGHVHHKSQSVESNGVVVETFNTLAPRDKYAHDHGYRSASAITAILLSKTYGEVGRYVIPAELVQDAIIREQGGKGSVFEMKRPRVYSV